MNYQRKIKLIYLIIFSLLLVAFFSSWLFMHNNFYKTYTQSGELENIETGARDVVNVALWEQVTKAQEQKAISVLPDTPLRNPFTFGP